VDDRVVRLGEDGVFTTIASPGGVRQLVLGPEGRLLAVAEAGVFELLDERWVARFEFDAGLGPVEHLAAGESEIWAIGEAAIGRFAGEHWTLADAIDREIVDAANAPGGDLYLLIGDRVSRFAGAEAPIDHATLPFAHARELAIVGSGRVAIAGGSCELAVIDPDKPEAGWQRGREPAYGCEYPTALALDERDRVWIGSTTGVHVLDAAGNAHAYPSGSVPELVGDLRAITVVGASPDALPNPGPVRTGSLAGRIEFRGKPAAKAKLQICPRPAPLFHASPCDHSTLHFGTTTDAEGRFSFEAIPLARYGWALQIGDQWTMTAAEAVPGRMREGEMLDLGTIRLE
jgi:hypothetical protein